MNKLWAIVITLIGIILILPLLGIDSLGTILEGTGAWITAIAVLILGLESLYRNFLKK
tara:strand:+ start:984 stop:1157 length:174 start_codon:yes stop_codon:yes gene_type:complete